MYRLSCENSKFITTDIQLSKMTNESHHLVEFINDVSDSQGKLLAALEAARAAAKIDGHRDALDIRIRLVKQLRDIELTRQTMMDRGYNV